MPRQGRCIDGVKKRPEHSRAPCDTIGITMRTYPDANDEYDSRDVEKMRPEQWMLELLKLNPDYVFWGPHEDYMWKRGRDEGPDGLGREQDHGWESRILLNGWSEFKDFKLNDLNECVNFYFEVDRRSEKCPVCMGPGIHPDAQWVTESWYGHTSPFRFQTDGERNAARVMAQFNDGESLRQHGCHRHGSYPAEEVLSKYGTEFREFCKIVSTTQADGWGKHPLTEDEIQALVDAGRDPEGMGRLGHDAINKSIVCRRRCERMGLPYLCPNCDGDGTVFVEDHCHVNLVLWWLHPRKGCSRGIEIKNIMEDDISAAYEFLARAAQRNADRFSKVVAISKA